MSGYVKLFSSILASTIWREPNHVRIVWITLLAMADKHGIAEGSVPGLADFARLSIDECRDALRRLSDPDRDSRSQEHEGRRIKVIDGGWQLLNHAKYREKMSADERREYNRLKQQESRERRQRDVSTSQPSSNAVIDVNDSQQTSALSAHTEAEADTDQIQKQKAKADARERAAFLVMSPAEFSRLRIHNAYVGARLRVPRKLHGDFIALLGGQEPETVLRAWYAEVDAELERTGESIVPDVWKWLQARFTAWAPTVAAADPWGEFRPQEER